MRFAYVFCCSALAYLLLRKKRKEASLRVIHSNNKIALFFKLIIDKFCQEFSPSPLFSSGHTQTILIYLIQTAVTVIKRFFRIYCFKYKRDIFVLKDGGSIALDRAEPSSKKVAFYSPDSILAVIPGYSSSSKDYYIRSFVDAFVNEFDCRVINMRGCGGVKLTNAKMLSTANVEDIAEVLESIAAKNPSKKIFLVGFSFGGMLTVRYLSQYRDSMPSCILGGVSLCYPQSWEIATNYSQNNLYGAYTRVMGNTIRDIFNENIDGIFSENTLNYNHEFYKQRGEIIAKMDEMVHASEFDQLYTWKSLGFPSFEEYKKDFDLGEKLKNIKVPHLSIFTDDDPIVPVNELKIAELKQNPNLITAISTSGGHLGFFSGLIPQRWVQKPIVAFIKTVELMSS